MCMQHPAKSWRHGGSATGTTRSQRPTRRLWRTRLTAILRPCGAPACLFALGLAAMVGAAPGAWAQTMAPNDSAASSCRGLQNLACWRAPIRTGADGCDYLIAGECWRVQRQIISADAEPPPPPDAGQPDSQNWRGLGWGPFPRWPGSMLFQLI